MLSCLKYLVKHSLYWQTNGGGKVGGAEGGQIYNCLDCTRLFMSAEGYAKHLKVFFAV
jgi:hypothetical protein